MEASFFVRMSWQIKIDLHYVVSDRVTLLVNSLEKNGKEILLCGIIKSYNKNTKKKEADMKVSCRGQPIKTTAAKYTKNGAVSGKTPDGGIRYSPVFHI